VSLLIAVRNIVAINLLEMQHLKLFVSTSTKLLLLPISLNIFGVFSLVAAFMGYAYSELKTVFFCIFVLLMGLPGILLAFGVTSKGIQNMYSCQPWYFGSMQQWSEKDQNSKNAFKDRYISVNKRINNPMN